MNAMAGESATNTEYIRPLNDGTEIESDSRLRRVGIFCGKLAALGTVMAASATAGVFHEPTSSQIGPHEAEIDLTLDSAVTFDLGPIGSIIKPLEGTHGVGAHIAIGEVPIRQNGISAESYARRLTNIEGEISTMRSDLVEQGVRFGLYGGALTIGAYALLGRQRRRELMDTLARPSVKVGVAAVTAVGLMGTTVVATGEVSSAEVSGVLVDGVFEDTPLEGARVTGEFLPHIVNTYGREIIDRWQENNVFYDKVIDNTRAAYEEGRRLRPREGHPIMLFYTDLHCNVGMARVIGEAARLSEADFIADGGDTTMGGTSYEKFCIQVLDNELPNIPRVVAAGNHDSHETEGQYRQFGFTPLDGEAVEVAGLTIIGDDDVMRSAFGTGAVQKGNETTVLMGERMADVACSENTDIDILLVHDPKSTEATLNEECVGTILSGHMHRETLETVPQTDGNTLLNLTGDNASGANKQQSTLGPIEAEAKLYMIKFNQITGRPVFYQTLTVNPDTSVELSPVVAVPQNLQTAK